MPDTTQDTRPTGNNLERIAPGLYVDDTGAEYFYLAGMYPCVVQRIVANPGLYTHAFVVDVLDELRDSLHFCRLELMD